VAALAVTRRFDLTDAQWAVLAPLLPVVRTGRAPKWTKRQLIDGVRWRVRVGAPWRDVPLCYGPWQTVYGLLRHWQRDGTWHRVITALQARAQGAGLIDWQVSVDSTSVRAHQHAAGARRDPGVQRESPGGIEHEPADHALGRSRGGWGTTLHLACEQGRKPLAVLMTAGQRGDAPQFVPVLEAILPPRTGRGRPLTRPRRVSADRAYASAANRAYLRRRGIRATIANKLDQIAARRRKGSKGGRPPSFDPTLYVQRHAVDTSHRDCVCFWLRFSRWLSLVCLEEALSCAVAVGVGA